MEPNWAWRGEIMITSNDTIRRHLDDPPHWLRAKWKGDKRDGWLLIGGARWPHLEVCFFDLPLFVKDHEVLEGCAHFTHRAIELLREPDLDTLHRTLQLHPLLLNAVLSELRTRGCVQQGPDGRWRSMFPAARERRGLTEVRRYDRAVITYVPSLEVLLTVRPSLRRHDLICLIGDQHHDYRKLNEHFNSLLARDSAKLKEMGLPERYTLDEDLSGELIDIAALVHRFSAHGDEATNGAISEGLESEDRRSKARGLMTSVELFLTLWTKLDGGVWRVQGEFALGALGASEREERPKDKSICDQLTTLNACLGLESETLTQCFEPALGWPFSGPIERGVSKQTLFAERDMTREAMDKRGSIKNNQAHRSPHELRVLKKDLGGEGEVYWAVEVARSKS